MARKPIGIVFCILAGVFTSPILLMMCIKMDGQSLIGPMMTCAGISLAFFLLPGFFITPGKDRLITIGITLAGMAAYNLMVVGAIAGSLVSPAQRAQMDRETIRTFEQMDVNWPLMIIMMVAKAIIGAIMIVTYVASRPKKPKPVAAQNAQANDEEVDEDDFDF